MKKIIATVLAGALAFGSAFGTFNITKEPVTVGAKSYVEYNPYNQNDQDPWGNWKWIDCSKESYESSVTIHECFVQFQNGSAYYKCRARSIDGNIWWFVNYRQPEASKALNVMDPQYQYLSAEPFDNIPIVGNPAMTGHMVQSVCYGINIYPTMRDAVADDAVFFTRYEGGYEHKYVLYEDYSLKEKITYATSYTTYIYDDYKPHMYQTRNDLYIGHYREVATISHDTGVIEGHSRIFFFDYIMW